MGAAVSDRAGFRPGIDTDSLERDELSRDTVFQTLSNRRRRLVLTYLGRHRERTVRLRDLSEWIAAEENGVPIAEVSYKQRKRVYTSLYQSHLPTLHRDGIVEYNQARGTITLTPTASALDVYLDPPSKKALPGRATGSASDSSRRRSAPPPGSRSCRFSPVSATGFR
ncbi:hypothetical protein D8S78_00240 [Natrialba swarupiae]|nr:hypothetical protein [Natrialba swarupiae]